MGLWKRLFGRKDIDVSNRGSGKVAKAFGQEYSADEANNFDKLAGIEYLAGNYPNAELWLKAAVAMDEKDLGKSHFMILDRMSKLCILFFIKGNLDAAKSGLAYLWQKKSGQHDITSARILFVLLTIALLESQPTIQFVEKLKTLLTSESLPDYTYADSKKAWNLTRFIEHIGPKLPPGNADFLTTLAVVFSDRSKLPDLDRYSTWYEAGAQGSGSTERRE